MAKSKPKSSAARMTEAGYRPVQLWLTPEQYEKVFAAAQLDHRPATQFLIHHGITAAKKILDKSGKMS